MSSYIICTHMQLMNCRVLDSVTVTCVTPALNISSLASLNYALIFDDAPPTTQSQFPINVQPDPTNLRLESSNMIVSGTPTIIRIVVCYAQECTLDYMCPTAI